MSKPSRNATARLFVAVDPPPAVCGELAAWARAALGRTHARLLGAETMHVTLCFLGARPVGEIDAIASAVERCPAEHLLLHVGAPLWLPPRRPRTLALEVGEQAGELTRLHASLCEELAAAIDWQRERRRFRAHVTVARLGRDAGAREGAALAPSPQLSFCPRELVLYRSLLAPEGASYEALTARELPASSAESSEEGSSASPSSLAAPGAELEPPGTRHAGGEPSAGVFGAESSSHSGGEPSSQT